MPILKFPTRLLLPEYEDGPSPDQEANKNRSEEDDFYGYWRARMLPEIEEWCQQTFGRIPTVDWADGSDYDRLSYWVIWFNSHAEATAFRLAWSDYKR